MRPEAPLSRPEWGGPWTLKRSAETRPSCGWAEVAGQARTDVRAHSLASSLPVLASAMSSSPHFAGEGRREEKPLRPWFEASSEASCNPAWKCQP